MCVTSNAYGNPSERCRKATSHMHLGSVLGPHPGKESSLLIPSLHSVGGPPKRIVFFYGVKSFDCFISIFGGECQALQYPEHTQKNPAASRPPCSLKVWIRSNQKVSPAFWGHTKSQECFEPLRWSEMQKDPSEQITEKNLFSA